MKLRFQKRALQQIDRALGYLAAQSPKGASKVEARMEEIIALARAFSLSGNPTPIPGVGRVYLTPYPYFIDYFIGLNEIVVQRFRRTSRKPLLGLV